MILKVLKFFRFMPELWLILISLPAIPIILFVHNDKIRNLLYLIFLPIATIGAVILLIKLKQTKISYGEKVGINADPILEALHQPTNTELFIDQNNIN